MSEAGRTLNLKWPRVVTAWVFYLLRFLIGHMCMYCSDIGIWFQIYFNQSYTAVRDFPAAYFCRSHSYKTAVPFRAVHIIIMSVVEFASVVLSILGEFKSV